MQINSMGQNCYKQNFGKIYFVKGGATEKACNLEDICGISGYNRSDYIYIYLKDPRHPDAKPFESRCWDNCRLMVCDDADITLKMLDIAAKYPHTDVRIKTC